MRFCNDIYSSVSCGHIGRSRLLFCQYLFLHARFERRIYQVWQSLTNAINIEMPEIGFICFVFVSVANGMLHSMFKSDGDEDNRSLKFIFVTRHNSNRKLRTEFRQQTNIDLFCVVSHSIDLTT